MDTPASLILRAYFGQPVASEALDAALTSIQLDGDGVEGGLVTRLDAAVAAILLPAVLGRLPQWATSRGDEVVLGRKQCESRYDSPFLPQHLFTLNWADSGPGFSWPTAYYATVVQPFGRVVVTASADSPDADGYSDFAIGSFPLEQDFVAGTREVIIQRWRELAQMEQERWAYLFDEGLVNKETANAWADDVWSPEVEGDEDEGDE